MLQLLAPTSHRRGAERLRRQRGILQPRRERNSQRRQKPSRPPCSDFSPPRCRAAARAEEFSSHVEQTRNADRSSLGLAAAVQSGYAGRGSLSLQPRREKTRSDRSSTLGLLLARTSHHRGAERLRGRRNSSHAEGEDSQRRQRHSRPSRQRGTRERGLESATFQTECLCQVSERRRGRGHVPVFVSRRRRRAFHLHCFPWIRPADPALRSPTTTCRRAARRTVSARSRSRTPSPPRRLQ